MKDALGIGLGELSHMCIESWRAVWGVLLTCTASRRGEGGRILHRCCARSTALTRCGNTLCANSLRLVLCSQCVQSVCVSSALAFALTDSVIFYHL